MGLDLLLRPRKGVREAEIRNILEKYLISRWPPPMSYEEMEREYDGEWVLVEDPETDESLKVIRGRVVAHSPDRDEIYRRIKELPLTRWATLCFKKIPEDMVIIL
jgi:hypothetical protein